MSPSGLSKGVWCLGLALMGLTKASFLLDLIYFIRNDGVSCLRSLRNGLNGISWHDTACFYGLDPDDVVPFWRTRRRPVVSPLQARKRGAGALMTS